MELTLSPEDAAFRDEVRAFIADNYPAEMRVPNPDTDLTKEQMLLWHRILAQEGLDRAALAEGVWWPRLVDHPTLHLRTGDDASRHDCRPWRSASPWSAPSSTRSATTRRRRSFCRVSCRARTGGARVIPSRARALTSPPSAPRRCATATITSSTATRRGPRSPSTPTGSFVWSAPIRPPNRNPASLSF